MPFFVWGRGEGADNVLYCTLYSTYNVRFNGFFLIVSEIKTYDYGTARRCRFLQRKCRKCMCIGIAECCKQQNKQCNDSSLR
jgi:hypothetical protein